MRPLRLTSLALLVVLAVAACSSGEQPGWTYAPAPSPTPVVAPSGSPGGSAAPSSSASEAPGSAIELTAKDVKFDKATILAPAGQAFQIKLVNNDAGIPHNVYIKDANGKILFEGKTINGVETIVYDIGALGSGSYVFYCSLHPTMTGTLTIG